MHPAINYIQQRREAFLEELKAFVRIPSVSTKSEHTGDVQKAAEWVATEMALHVLAYNMTRAMSIMGVRPLMTAMRA